VRQLADPPKEVTAKKRRLHSAMTLRSGQLKSERIQLEKQHEERRCQWLEAGEDRDGGHRGRTSPG
jgi:hypothetical protein